MTLQQQRSDVGLATALRISVSRLARRLRVERLVPELAEPAPSDTQLAALATLERLAGFGASTRMNDKSRRSLQEAESELAALSGFDLAVRPEAVVEHWPEA